MKKSIKILGILSLSCFGTMVTSPQKKAIDVSTKLSGDAIKIKKNQTIGNNEETLHSNTFVQYGTKGGDQFMRFSTAIKGDVFNLNYQLSYIDGEKVVQDYPINSVYKAILADGKVTYYDGNSTTTNEAYAGEYYWACLTIKFNSNAMKDVKFEAKFSYTDANDSLVEVEEKTSSLDEITLCKITLTNGVFEDDNNEIYLTKNDTLPNIKGDQTPLILMDIDDYSLHELNYTIDGNRILAVFYLEDNAAVGGYYTPSDVVKYGGSEVDNNCGQIISEDGLFKNGTHYVFGEKAMSSEYTIIDDGASTLKNSSNPISSTNEKAKLSIMSFRNNNDFNLKFSFGPEFYGRIYSLENIVVKAHETISIPMYSKGLKDFSGEKLLHFIEFKESYETVGMDIIGHFINKTAYLTDFAEDSFTKYKI